MLVASLCSLALVDTSGRQLGGAIEVQTLDTMPPIELAAVQTNDIYLEVTGFTGGESTASKHSGLSTVIGVTSGVTRSSPTAKAIAESFIITKPIDAYTIQFAKAVNTGIHLATVRIFFTTPGQAPIDKFVYTLSDVVVMRSAQSFKDGDSTETVRLFFNRISMVYRKQNTTGTVTVFTYCWDYPTNTSCA